MSGKNWPSIGLALIVLVAAAGAARAETAAPADWRLATQTPPRDQGCGYGAYRAPNGACDIVRDPNGDCQPGFHASPGPFGDGFRCVQGGY